MSNFSFDGTYDYFDSRDVIERIEELTSAWEDATGNVASDYVLSEGDWAAGIGSDAAAELVRLLAFVDEAGSIPDWQYGVTFVSEDGWVEYVRELLDDAGYLPADLPDWIEIDWDATAKNVQQDYSDYELNGTTYWARA